MIILEVLAIFIAVGFVLWDYFGNALIVVILLLLGHFIYRYRKESKSFSFFKKTKHITELDLILSMINQINSYKKIIINKNNIILIMKKGIFFIKVLDYTGTITGSKDDKYLLKKENNKNINIVNELDNYEEEYKNYKNKIDYEILKYLVIKNNCIFNVKIDNKIKLIKSRNIYFEIEKLNKNYSIKDIENIYSALIL